MKWYEDVEMDGGWNGNLIGEMRRGARLMHPGSACQINLGLLDQSQSEFRKGQRLVLDHELQDATDLVISPPNLIGKIDPEQRIDKLSLRSFLKQL